MEAREVLDSKTIDLMFLDINMPQVSGLDFLESLENPPLTIITTAYSEYALEGFRLHVIDYLLKPIGFQRFFDAVSKAKNAFETKIILQQKNQNIEQDMYIRQGDSFVKILPKEILYIESMQNYVRIHQKDRVHTIHQTMSSLEDILPKDIFIRIHRSYLINSCHIEEITINTLKINNINLPIAKIRKDALLQSVVYKGLISK